MSSSDLALSVSGLGRRYRRGWALRDCAFDLPAGRVAALVGPNGAGKSTLMRLAAGIVRPTQGGVRIFGEPPGHRADLYQPPLYATQSLDIRDADSAVPDDAWWLRSGFHNLAGDEVRTPNHCFVNSIVPDSDGSTDPPAVAAMLDERVACLRGVGLADRFTWYQPMERFWPFQFIESGVVLLLSLALLGLGAVAVRRRLY